MRLINMGSDVTKCCYDCVEHVKFYNGTKFHGHQSKNNEVMIVDAMPSPKTEGPKKPMTNRVKRGPL